MIVWSFLLTSASFMLFQEVILNLKQLVIFFSLDLNIQYSNVACWTCYWFDPYGLFEHSFIKQGFLFTIFDTYFFFP